MGGKPGAVELGMQQDSGASPREGMGGKPGAVELGMQQDSGASPREGWEEMRPGGPASLLMNLTMA